MVLSTPAAAGQVIRYMRQADARPQQTLPLVQVHNLEKTYRTSRGDLTLFRGLELTVKAGELVAIVGQSGTGKSTLLRLAVSLSIARVFGA